MSKTVALTPKANQGEVVRTISLVRGQHYALIPAGCRCTVVQVEPHGRRYRYLVELNGMMVWADDSEIEPGGA